MEEVIRLRAQLLDLKSKQLKLEKKIEELFRVSVKRDDLVMDRNEDWGRKGFSVNIFFDDFGVTTFKKNIEEILKWLIEYQEQRKEENKIIRGLQVIGAMQKGDLEQIGNVMSK